MTRIIGALVYNWPLKLAAIVLSTLLYAGFVVSQSALEFLGTVPVDPQNQPANAVLLSNLPPVTRIRYLVTGDGSASPSTDSFVARIDLSTVDPKVGSTYVPISVQSRDPRFVVIGFEPPGVNVQLDPFVSKQVPVRVNPGPTPPGLEVRPPEVTPETVTVSGPESVVRRVVAARADVVIEPNALDVDRDVELIPVDILGDALAPADVDPTSARIRIAVFTNRETRSLPVNPIVTGTPAAGYEIASVRVDPLIVPVEGDAEELAALSRADTVPIAINGTTQTIERDVELALPAGVLPLGQQTVRVTIALRPVAATRTFDAGIALDGASPDLQYGLSIGRILATVGGPVADLDRLEAATFTLSAPVGGLGPGRHEVTLVANLPTGLGLVGVEPAIVVVTISAPPPASSPAASP